MIVLDPDLDHDPASEGRKISVRALARFLARAQSALPLRGEVNVLLTTDRAIRRMNRQYRGKDRVTDVLSFPASELARSRNKNRERIAGDLAISVETARRQAVALGHEPLCELQILTLHGLLHLAGFDHESDEGGMARREGRLRTQFGLPHGLIERAGAAQSARPKVRRGAPASAQGEDRRKVPARVRL